MEKEKPSIPSNTNMQVSISWGDEKVANEFGSLLFTLLTEISKTIDISKLDGVTVASDYKEALLKLDRGIDTNSDLKPTDTHVQGIAMAPSVIRDGEVKRHLVFSADHLSVLIADKDVDGFQDSLNQVIYTVAHECAHVETGMIFNRAFPDIVLKKQLNNIIEQGQYQAIYSCWDEFSACFISASIGANQENAFVDALKDELDTTNKSTELFINEYRFHGDISKLYWQVADKAESLMRFSSYCIGDSSSKKLDINSYGSLNEFLKDSWYKPYYVKLNEILIELNEENGEWENISKFESIGLLFARLLNELGLYFDEPDVNGNVYIDVP